VHPVIGDLAEPRLGIDPGWIAEHSGAIDHVFHLAAIYDMTADEQRNRVANVEGTRHAVEVANALQAGRLHHVSSVAAAGMYQGTFTEEMFDEGQPLEHPYHATKFESERIAREESTVPWRVYRPAVVVGHSQTGEMDKIDGPYYFFKTIKLASHLPEMLPLLSPMLGETNIVPVDFVADAMDYLAHADGLDERAFHLVSPDPQRSAHVINTFARIAGAPRIAELLPGAALPLALRLPGAGEVLKRLEIPQEVIDYVDFTAQFASLATRDALAGSGITVPALDDYAPVLWAYWEEQMDGA
jgi:thioester reductase-like protein